MLPLFYTKLYKKHAKHLFPRISGAAPACCSCRRCSRRRRCAGPVHRAYACCRKPAPRCARAVHDPLSITAGVPYEGRPALHRGDNESAMRPTPSLLGRPGADKPPAAMV